MSEASIAMGDGKMIPLCSFGTYLCTKEDVLSSCGYAIRECQYIGIDTAEGYNNEDSVGEVLKSLTLTVDNKNEQSNKPINFKPFITTKLWPGMGENIKSYDEVITSCLNSLKKLQLEQVDLYLIHAPFAGSLEPNNRIQQWKALLHLQSIHKCISIGVSNYSIKHLDEIKEANLPLPAVNQLELHPLCQHKDIIEYCKNNNILPVAYSSLAPLSTWRTQQNSGKNKLMQDEEFGSHVNAANVIIDRLALKYNITNAILLYKWGKQHGYPLLPKSNTFQRIKANIECVFDSTLISTEDMCVLDGLDLKQSFAWPNGDPVATL